MADVNRNDRREIGKFMRFLERAREMPAWQAYAETYGEVVYEAKDDAPAADEKGGD